MPQLQGGYSPTPRLVNHGLGGFMPMLKILRIEHQNSMANNYKVLDLADRIRDSSSNEFYP